VLHVLGRFVAVVALVGLSLAISGPALGATEEETSPDEWPRDNGGTGACDNYRCECGDQCGCGAGCGCGTSTASMAPRGTGGFASDNVTLKSRVSVQAFGPELRDGNDCWGYVSPSGREYALMGLDSAVGVVEITDPVNPVIVGIVPHTESPWADIKTYGGYAYAVNESGDGVQVIDLTGVDGGEVELVNEVDLGGSAVTSHNIVINETSGFAYLCGSNGFNGGLVALDLSDPASPAFAGAYADTYVHDAEVVSFEEGPYAGREIAFCYAAREGLDIVDVTDKSDMERLSRTTYPGLQYVHQGWLDRGRMLVYLNDELDERNGVVPTATTRVFDVSSLSFPTLAGSFGSGLPVIDHNLYARDGFIYEANYRSGLRVFDARKDGVSPLEVGSFDTFAGPDGFEYDGAWSVYPFFPSGMVIVSDIQSGLLVLDPSFALVGGAPASVSLLEKAPAQLLPAGQTLSVSVAALNGASLVGAPRLVYDAGDGFESVELTPVGGGSYEAAFPALPCGASVSYYLEAETDTGLTVREPANAPAQTLGGVVYTDEEGVFSDTFEQDRGWVVGAPSDTAETGVWVRAAPAATEAQPGSDSALDSGPFCYITGNNTPGASSGVNDVDGGATTLTSPVLDASGGGEAFVSYERWYSNDRGDNPNEDVFRVEISDDGGTAWTLLEETSENANAWVFREFRVSDYVSETSSVRVRFIASDEGAPSIVEAGVDRFGLRELACLAGCPADLTGDRQVGSADLGVLLSAWGSGGVDLTGDGATDSADLGVMLASWGSCD